MSVLSSRLDPASEDARVNTERMTALVAELRARMATVSERGAGGDDRSIARHRERGKLPVRERIDRLLDPGIVGWRMAGLRILTNTGNGNSSGHAALEAENRRVTLGVAD